MEQVHPIEELNNTIINDENLIQVQPNQVVTRSGTVNKPQVRYEPALKGKNYANVHVTVKNGKTFEYDSSHSFVLIKIMNEYALHQYSLRAGIKKFGDRGHEGAYKEVEQLHLRNAFNPVKFD